VSRYAGCGNTEHTVTCALKLGLTLCVVLLLVVVHWAIDLDDQPSGGAVEIDYVRAYWLLASKLEPANLSSSQLLPE
jgi:hypothetical protein